VKRGAVVKVNLYKKEAHRPSVAERCC